MKDLVLVDSHCHLLYYDEQHIDHLISSAELKNVKFLNNIATKLDENHRLVRISNSKRNVFHTVGVHPCNVKVYGDVPSVSVLIEMSNESKAIAFGETGIDFFHDEGNYKELQLRSFESHIEASIKANLPLVIHSRNAEELTREILVSYANKIQGVLHCFTGSEEFALNAVDLGFYISFSGIITFKNAEHLRILAKKIPKDRILIETDAPYLAPVPFRGQNNVPAYTYYIAECMSNLLGISIEELGCITTNNFFELFSKAKDFLNL